MQPITCFKAYDIRGKLGTDIDNDVAYLIGRAFAQFLNAKRLVVGSDIRLSSPTLKEHLAQGMMDAGADVIDIGTTGTEEVYFAAFHLDVDGGVEVTASHNPIDYNGMKLAKRGAQPISGDSGLNTIKKIAESKSFTDPKKKGSLTQLSILDAYVDHLMTYINTSHISPLKIVANAGNGAAGHVIDKLEDVFQENNIPINFVKIHHEADGQFPHGIPNPLLTDNRAATIDAVKKHDADMGIAWDGDFDRCFLFDENGGFIEGYYIVGLLAEAFLKKNPGEKIIHDPRLTWNTIDIVEKAGGMPIQCKTGHAFIKERMRIENAIYGGEMSAHHYFRDFAYCDSGMIPWLLVAELLSTTGKPLSKLIDERMAAHPCSGEINYRVQDAQSSIKSVKEHFEKSQPPHTTDMTDGLSMEFADWRFNLRASNTEPLLRLNVETLECTASVPDHVSQIAAIIEDSD